MEGGLAKVTVASLVDGQKLPLLAKNRQTARDRASQVAATPERQSKLARQCGKLGALLG